MSHGKAFTNVTTHHLKIIWGMLLPSAELGPDSQEF